MNSSIIGKIEKARRYTFEPERFQLAALVATFRGEHDRYDLTLADGAWRCSCHFFAAHDTCAHIMATQRLLAAMLPATARYEHTARSTSLGSGQIGKIDKVRRYTEEPDRLTIASLKANFRGSNGDHLLTIAAGGWRCACDFSTAHDTCAHVMAAQRILASMLPETARYEYTALSTAALATAGV